MLDGRENTPKWQPSSLTLLGGALNLLDAFYSLFTPGTCNPMNQRNVSGFGPEISDNKSTKIIHLLGNGEKYGVIEALKVCQLAQKNP